jgi:hypothetical protein
MRKTIAELIEYLEHLQYNEDVYFKDDIFNNYCLCVEEDYISLDDSIPEDELTDEDVEYYPRAKVRHEDCYYHCSTSAGNTIMEAAARALHELEMIDDETLSRFIS